MNDLSVQVNMAPQNEWLSLKEAARLKGVTANAIAKALRKRPDLKNKYTKQEGNRLFLSQKGFLVLFNIEDSARGGLRNEESTLPDRAPTKEALAEKLIALVEENKILKEENREIKTEILTNQLELDKKIQALEDRTQKTTRLLEDSVPLNITTAQRQYLNERIRYLGIQSAVPFGMIWRGVHDHVGKHAVELYEFEDYAVAIKYLKKTYTYYGLDW